MGEGSRRNRVRFMKPGFSNHKWIKGVSDKEVMERGEFVTDRAGIPEGAREGEPGFRRKRNGN